MGNGGALPQIDEGFTRLGLPLKVKSFISLLPPCMSAADIAVQAFRRIEPEDIQVLRAVELGMSRHEYVPENVVLRLSGLHEREFEYRISRLREFRLIRRWVGPYVGYVLNMAGYDCLAINAFVRRGVIEAFGKPLGVGKEADVYDALTPSGERVAVKFQRLGRTSFRQTRRVRGYAGNRRHISWLYRSRLAAEREFEALQLLYPAGVSVPRPISQNRHAIVMGIITVIYTSFGGLRGVVLTDVVQTFILFGGTILAIVLIIKQWGSVSAIIPSQWPQQWAGWVFFDTKVRVSFLTAFIATFGWYVCTAGSDQMAIQRYLATKDVKAARRMYLSSLITNFLTYFLLAVLGLALFAYFKMHPQLLAADSSLTDGADLLFPLFIIICLPAGISIARNT